MPIYPTQFLVGVVLVSQGPLLDSVLKDLGIPLAQGGLPSVAFFLGMVLGVVCLNVFLARVPAKSILVGAALVEAAGLAVAGLLSRGLGSIFAAYLIVGFGNVVLSTVPGMWLSAHARQGAARALLLMVLFFAAGMMITPLALGLLQNSGVTWRWLWTGEAGLSLCLAGVLSALPFADIPGREGLRLRHVREVVRFNRPLFVVMLAASFAYVGAETTMNVWLPKFEIEVFDAGDAWASLAVTSFWVGMVTGRLGAIPLTRRFYPSRILVGCGSALAVLAAGVALSPNREASLALAFAAGLGASASFPLIGSYSGAYPRWHAGVVFSAFVLAGNVGSVVFPYVVGPVADALGFRAALAVTVLPAALVAGLATYLHRASGEGALP